MSNMTLGEQLQAALVAKQWAEDDVAHKRMEQGKPSPFQITNNLSRATFEQIKHHPDTRKNVTQALLGKGYKIGSVSALIGQLLRNGYVQEDDEGILHTTVPDYRPLKNSTTLKNLKKKKVVVVNVREKKVDGRPVSSSKAAGLTALVPKEKEIPRIDALLRSLSVLEARELYDALRNIFGDNK